MTTAMLRGLLGQPLPHPKGKCEGNDFAVAGKTCDFIASLIIVFTVCIKYEPVHGELVYSSSAIYMTTKYK